MALMDLLELHKSLEDFKQLKNYLRLKNNSARVELQSNVTDSNGCPLKYKKFL